MAYIYTLLFVVQGILMVAFGMLPLRAPSYRAPGTGNRLAICLILIALVVVPVTGLLDGRAWSELDYFGVAPDSTALVTVGFLVVSRRSSQWWLLIIPVTWVLISCVHAWPLDMLQGPVHFLLLLVYLVFFLSIPAQSTRSGD